MDHFNGSQLHSQHSYQFEDVGIDMNTQCSDIHNPLTQFSAFSQPTISAQPSTSTKAVGFFLLSQDFYFNFSFSLSLDDPKGASGRFW